MTSANLSDTPALIDDDLALMQLSGIADGFLIHNLQEHILVGIGGEIILLLALFKHQQKCPLTGIKPRIFQGFLDKFCLTGI